MKEMKIITTSLVIFVIALFTAHMALRSEIRGQKNIIQTQFAEDNELSHIAEVLMTNFSTMDSVQAYGFARMLYDNSKQYNVDWELVASIMYYESGFNCGSYNNSGATGLMQILPSTAKGIADGIGLKRYNLSDPFTNTMIGTAYLAQLIKSKKSLNLVIKTYVGDKTGSSEAAKYRGGVMADYLRMKRMK